MPLMLNPVLESAGLNPADVRLLRHKDQRAAKGRGPYELWRDGRVGFDAYQSTQRFENESKLRAPFWASFVVTPRQEVLFVGIYRVEGCRVLDRDVPSPHMDGFERAGSCNLYELRLDERLQDLIGRLVIAWGAGERSWIQRAERQNKPIVEIRRVFEEPAFPGYLDFVGNLSSLERLPPTWAEVLRSARGVYVLTCPRTKEQYVGSATGAAGFLQRWAQYATDGHGGNIGLKSRDLSDYQVSILEVAGTAATVDEILGMEIRWKEKLQSRQMGLNRN